MKYIPVLLTALAALAPAAMAKFVSINEKTRGKMAKLRRIATMSLIMTLCITLTMSLLFTPSSFYRLAIVKVYEVQYEENVQTVRLLRFTFCIPTEFQKTKRPPRQKTRDGAAKKGVRFTLWKAFPLHSLTAWKIVMPETLSFPFPPPPKSCICPTWPLELLHP